MRWGGINDISLYYLKPDLSIASISLSPPSQPLLCYTMKESGTCNCPLQSLIFLRFSRYLIVREIKTGKPVYRQRDGIGLKSE